MVASSRAARALAPVAFLALVALASGAAAQHAHEGGAAGVVVAHDAPASGRTYVGQLASYAVLDLGADDVPDVHQQNHIRVRQGDLVVFETTADSGHDYDGVNAFSVAFPLAGPYVVEALDDAGAPVAAFEGTVAQPANATVASLVVEGPAEVPALASATFRYHLADVALTPIPHSDVQVEVRQGDVVLFRTHTHTHDEPQELAYSFPLPGTYTVRFTGYLAFASGKGREFPQVVAERTVTVTAPASAPSLALPDLALPGDANVALTAPAGDCTLVGTYDPYTQVGPTTQQHLSVLTMRGHATVQHVDYKARLDGPLGQVFASTTLHEYDGIYDVLARQAAPGGYRLTVEADAGDGCKGAIALPYQVLPAGTQPAVPALGPQAFAVQAPATLQQGVPAAFTITGTDALGRPFAHGELDLTWLDAAGRIGLQAKAHTHADGTFAFTALPPGPGATTLRIAPSSLEPGLPVTYQGEGGASLDLTLQVLPDAAFQERSAFALTNDIQPDDQASPAPVGALVGLSLLALAAARRPRLI